MAKLTDNQRLLAILGVTVVLCGAAGGGVYWAKGKVDEQLEEIEGKRVQIQAAEAKIAKIPELERDVIILRENVKEYVKILPEKQELNAFVRAAQQFTQQAEVTIERFAPARAAARKGAEFEEWTYSFDVRATLWQFLKFVNFFENYERFVKVKSFTLTSGGETRELDGGEVQHKISLLVETYVYTGNAKGSDVVIPNYEAKQQALAEEIVRNLQEIRIDTYEFKDAHGRRDIFVDPREFSYGRDSGGMPLQQQKKILDEFTDEVTRLYELHKRTKDAGITIFEKYALERNLKQGLEELLGKAEDIDKQKVLSYQPFKLQWTKRVVQPIETLQLALSDSGRVARDQFLDLAEVEGLAAAMRQDLQTGELQSARDRYEAVQTRLDVPQGDPRHKLVQLVREYHLRANIALEFQMQRIDISGVVVNEQGRSGLILNGAVYQEGDYVSDDLLVKGVDRDHVEFVYKGFTLLKTR